MSVDKLLPTRDLASVRSVPSVPPAPLAPETAGGPGVAEHLAARLEEHLDRPRDTVELSDAALALAALVADDRASETVRSALLRADGTLEPQALQALLRAAARRGPDGLDVVQLSDEGLRLAAGETSPVGAGGLDATALLRQLGARPGAVGQRFEDFLLPLLSAHLPGLTPLLGRGSDGA